MQRNSIVQEQQAPLRASYANYPELAMVTDVAIVEGNNLDDPFHTSVTINDELLVPFNIGVHRAVGGLHDFANPGDLLCASLAACFESTLRMVSNIMGIRLKKTLIMATAQVDVRGTLKLDKNVPVGFQSMDLDVDIEVDDLVDETTLLRLIASTEKCCIIFQTLIKAIPININNKSIFR